MTKNQIDYQSMLENRRHNEVTEQEALRHNQAYESETVRHNTQTEALGYREAQIAQRNSEIGYLNALANQTSAAASYANAQANQMNAQTKKGEYELKVQQWEDPLGGGKIKNTVGVAGDATNVLYKMGTGFVKFGRALFGGTGLDPLV